MVYYIFTAMLLVIIAILSLYKFKILKDEAEDVKDAASNLLKQTGDVFDADAGKKNKI